MADRKVRIEVETTADTKGLDETNRKLESTGAAGESAGKKIADGARSGGRELDESGKKASGLSDQFKKMSERAELFGKVMRGLGVVGIFSMIGDALQGLTAYIADANSAGERMTLEKIARRSSEAVTDLAAAFETLKTKITDAAASLQKLSEIESISKGGRRALEDAKSQLAEADEIAALDPSDPERSQREAAIRARYSRQRAVSAVDRKKEDIQTQRAQLNSSASVSETSASELESRISGMEARRAAEASKAEELKYRSAANRRYRWTLTGGETYDTPLSNEYSKASDASAAAAEKLAQMIEEAKRQAKALRDDALQNRAKAAAMEAFLAPSDTERRAADVSGASSERIAVKVLQSSIQSRAREEARRQAEADAPAMELSAASAERGSILSERGRLLSRSASAASARASFVPGITRSEGRLVSQSEVDAALERAQRAYDDYNRTIADRLDRIAKREEEARNQLKRMRDAD